MTAPLKQQARVMAAVLRDQRLAAIPSDRVFAACFAETPTFRTGFDAHVRAWRKAMQRAAYLRWHTDAAFRSAYDAEVARRRALPMPAWGVAA